MIKIVRTFAHRSPSYACSPPNALTSVCSPPAGLPSFLLFFTPPFVGHVPLIPIAPHHGLRKSAFPAQRPPSVWPLRRLRPPRHPLSSFSVSVEWNCCGRDLWHTSDSDCVSLAPNPDFLYEYYCNGFLMFCLHLVHCKDGDVFTKQMGPQGEDCELHIGSLPNLLVKV